jgi:hypothetical protein
MRIIITESQYNRLNKSSQGITNAIIKYMNEYIAEGKRKVTPKTRHRVSSSEAWCVNGKETLRAIYYYKDDRFEKGYLSISHKIVDNLSKLLSIRRSYVLHVIEEWYDETMIPKFEAITGESGLGLDEIDTWAREEDCLDEPVKLEGITDKEMIEYIVKHTLYTKEEVIDKIESGEADLNDLYLDIVDTQNRKERRGI